MAEPYQRAIIQTYRRQRPQFEAAMKTHLLSDFKSLGMQAKEAWLSEAVYEAKLSDTMNAHKVVLAIGLTAWLANVLKNRYEENIKRVLSETVKTVESVFSTSIELPSSIEAQVLHKGGLRMGLLDIERDTKDAILRAIAQGREDQLDFKAIGDLIEKEVPKGRYVNAGSAYRAEMIAKTESRYAQNISSVSVYRSTLFVTEALAFDGNSDEECTARDGSTFSFAEAEQEAATTHPNCVLQFAPVVTGLQKE